VDGAELVQRGLGQRLHGRAVGHVGAHADGPVRGSVLLPLYPNLPLAAAKYPALYELLALFDALRIGQAREREMARKLLEERLS